MSRTTGKTAFRTGIRDGLPFLLVVVPLAMLFGVVATEAGLPLVQIMAMTSLVIAGASQFAALQLMLEDASFWLIVGGGLAVNLRMAMYSAHLVGLLGTVPLWQKALAAYLMFDQTYALTAARGEEQPQEPVADRMAYYFGAALPVAPSWIGSTLLGAMVGEAIPASLALDFALPITFVALVAPMLKTLAHVVAAATSIVVALALIGLPAGAGLLLAAVAAMFAGALTEMAMGREI